MSKRRSEKFRLNVTSHGEEDVEMEFIPQAGEGGDVGALEGDALAEQNSEPHLVETDDGRLIINMKPGLTCTVCQKAFETANGLAKHKKEVCNVETTLPDVDVLDLERKAAKSAMPGEEFFKYCDPNPENPCYCCGEDISTAHTGHIRCKFCPKSFKAYEYMERHLASVHAEDDTFACPQCNAKCSSAKILNDHLLTHSDGKPFSCLRCSKDFTRKYHLDRHLNHSSCGDKPKHLQPCEVCGKEFARLDNLREHLRFHMGEGTRKRDYQCPYCPKSFYGSSLLNIHIRTHTGEKPFPCDLCSKSFPSTGALRKHRRSHTGERPYRCDQCSATFAARETLNRHRKTHTGEKPHVCSICHKGFIQASQLRSHMFQHTGEGGFECDQCGATFNRKTRLTEHTNYVHQQKKPLECSTCGKEFLRKEDLQRHMDTHAEIKNFECSDCGKRFVSRTALNTHLRVHNIEEPAICTICDKEFLRQDCLTRHMRSKHRDQYYMKEESEDGEEKQPSSEPAETTPVEVAEDDEHVLEIDGEVYQITPLEEVHIVRIGTSANTSATVKTEEGKKIEVLEVVNIEPPQEAKPKVLVEKAPQQPAKVTMPVEKKPKKEKPKEEASPVKEKVAPAMVKLPVPSIVSKEPKEPKERKKRKQNAESDAVVRRTKIKKEKPDDSVPIFLSDSSLKQKISELLCLLIDEEMLEEFGWPKAPVEEVLSNVIVRCGHKPARDEEDMGGDATTRMRENTKILFSLTMDDDNIKTLLNNHTVDEVIMNVLKTR
uniref:Putative gonadotropin inducible transcription factor n=1 Tax=Culex tarsalis TaxID=7177 RepID=A0A1Q3FGX3_CULTA